MNKDLTDTVQKKQPEKLDYPLNSEKKADGTVVLYA
jgi:hypothetical protein